MTIKDMDVICEALAEVEQINEEFPDPNGVGAATLRLVVDRLAAHLEGTNARFNRAIFEKKATPISEERLKQAIILALSRS